jgi:hypothetical protein
MRVYINLFFSIFLFISLGISELVILDEIVRNTIWCYGERCWKNITTGYNGVTNECNMDSDCSYNLLFTFDCPFLYFNPTYYASSDMYCTPMGNEGKKYCTVGCRLTQQPRCSPSLVPLDPLHGTMVYCYMYYDTVSGEIVPYCPCTKYVCNTETECVYREPSPAYIQPHVKDELVAAIRALDSTTYGGGKPVIFFAQTVDGIVERSVAYNLQNDGLGAFTVINNAYSADIDNMHSEQLVGANNGALCVYTSFSTCGGTSLKYALGTQTIDGLTDTITMSSGSVCTSNTGEREVALVIRDVDDIPLALWVRNGNLYVAENGVTDGTGVWTEYTVRTVSSKSITGTKNSFVKLSNGGYGIYYFQRVLSGSTIINTWEYSYTEDTTGRTGWIHQTIFTTGNNRRGVLGVDGMGLVYIAHTLGENVNGFAKIQIQIGIDASGSSFIGGETIQFDSSCTLAGINRRRSILLADSTTALLATCQNQRLFFLWSLTPSAIGLWGTQRLIYKDASFSAVDPTGDTSIGITTGSGNPHIVYRKLGSSNVTFVQSLLPTRF